MSANPPFTKQTLISALWRMSKEDTPGTRQHARTIAASVLRQGDPGFYFGKGNEVLDPLLDRLVEIEQYAEQKLPEGYKHSEYRNELLETSLKLHARAALDLLDDPVAKIYSKACHEMTEAEERPIGPRRNANRVSSSFTGVEQRPLADYKRKQREDENPLPPRR